MLHTVTFLGEKSALDKRSRLLMARPIFILIYRKAFLFLMDTIIKDIYL